MTDILHAIIRKEIVFQYFSQDYTGRLKNLLEKPE